MHITHIDGTQSELDLSNELVKAHFSDPHNYTAEILAEWDSQPFKEFFTKEDKVVLDIGANVGLFALHVIPFAEKIICVEPTPAHMEVQKILLAPFQEKVIHEQTALNSYTGQCEWHIEPVNFTMNTIREGTGLKVDCITLADLCAKHGLDHVDFAKIDIENSEVLALTEDTVRPVFDIIDKFLTELHPRTREMQDRFKAIFEACGYKVDYYDFNGSIFCHK